MNKGKERGKTNKAILGIALAAVVLASVTIAMLGSIGAYSTGGPYNIIEKSVSNRVLVGQDLQFPSATWPTAPQVMRYESGNLANIYTATTGTSGYYIYNVNWPTTGVYYINGNSSSNDGLLSYEEPHIPLKLKVGTKEVSSVARGKNITIDIGGINLFDMDKVDLVIMGPKGQITEKNRQTFKGKRVGDLKDMEVDTTNWDVGSYTFQVKTKSDKACGLDDQSPKKDLTIMKAAVTITADTTEVPELAVVKLTVTGTAGHTVNVKENTESEHAYFPAGLDNNKESVTTNNFTDVIDDDGKRTYAVEFDDTGLYTIKVTDETDSEHPYDTVDITVTEKEVIFDVPATIAIGERVAIKGTANTGTTVTVAVDDEVVQRLDNIVIDENGEFEEEIDTSACDSPAAFGIPGLVTLRAYIDRAEGMGTIGPYERDDGATKVFMVRPWLTAWLSTDTVDLGDEFTISGTAKGTKVVDILIVAPKGYSGTNIEDSTERRMYEGSTGVSTTDGTFLKKIEVGRYVDTGRYLVVVLSRGSNDYYGSGMDWCTIDDALTTYSLRTRTQDEMLAVFDDILELSDDIIWVGYVTVGEQETLTLNPVADVVTGDSLEVTGNSSRKEGTIIWLTVKGRYFEIVPQAAYVSDNTFSAAFDTTGAPHGVYTVQAMDGYGYTATTTVHIYTVGLVPTSFDTGAGTYPSIMGTHKGTITIQRRQ